MLHKHGKESNPHRKINMDCIPHNNVHFFISISKLQSRNSLFSNFQGRAKKIEQFLFVCVCVFLTTAQTYLANYWRLNLYIQTGFELCGVFCLKGSCFFALDYTLDWILNLHKMFLCYYSYTNSDDGMDYIAILWPWKYDSSIFHIIVLHYSMQQSEEQNVCQPNHVLRIQIDLPILSNWQECELQIAQ